MRRDVKRDAATAEVACRRPVKDVRDTDIPSSTIILAACAGISILALLPSGLLHIQFGQRTYLRDVLLFASTGCAALMSIAAVYANRVLLFLVAYCSWVSVVLLAAGGLTLSGFVGTALILKWFALWMVSAFWGYWTYERLGTRAMIPICIIVLCEIIVEACVGWLEIKTGNYFLTFGASEVTRFGVSMAISQEIEGVLRVRGLQRDVFQFANLMGLGSVIALSMAVIYRRRYVACALMGAISVFLFVTLLKSGGRSALFGVAFAVILSGLAAFTPTRWRWMALASGASAWGVVVFVTTVGIGPVTSFIVSLFRLSDFYGNVDSSYMRDAAWLSLWQTVAERGSSLLLGAPLTGFWVDKVTITDNWLIWNIYHAGMVIASGFIAFTVWTLTLVPSRTRIGVLLYALFGFLIGEGVARDAFFFFSSVVFFFVAGAAAAMRHELLRTGGRTGCTA